MSRRAGQCRGLGLPGARELRTAAVGSGSASESPPAEYDYRSMSLYWLLLSKKYHIP